jgi:hypothetical protein
MEPPVAENIEEVSEKVKEYAELSKTIKIMQEKLKFLNKQKKELYKEVIPKLKTVNITKCNLAFGTLKVNRSKRKIMPTKTSMKDKYTSFFSSVHGDPIFMDADPNKRAELMYKYIYVDNIEFKELHSITMTYNKQFRDQFKELKM